MSASSAARVTRFAPRFVIAATAAASLSACGINSVPTAQENAKAKWADVQAAFQERANLVPNLASVAKGAADQEKGILVGVVEARAKATSIQIKADDLGDPAKMAEFSAAQNQLSRWPVSDGCSPMSKPIPSSRASPITRCCRASWRVRKTASG